MALAASEEQETLAKIHEDLRKYKKVLATTNAYLEAIPLYNFYDSLLEQLQKTLKRETPTIESTKRLTPALTREYAKLEEKVKLLNTRRDNVDANVKRLGKVKNKNMTLAAVAWLTFLFSLFPVFGALFCLIAFTTTPVFATLGAAGSLMLISLFLTWEFKRRWKKAGDEIYTLGYTHGSIETDAYLLDKELDEARAENQKSIPQGFRQLLLRDTKLMAEKDIAALKIALAEINSSIKKAEQTVFQVGDYSIFTPSEQKTNEKDRSKQHTASALQP